jgi:hypothetical protein
MLEQNVIKKKNYAEAIRYMNNAKETLKKAGKEDAYYYKDEKYVKMACATAYSGILFALDTWLKLKGIEHSKKNRLSIDFYKENISKIDKKILSRLDTAYKVLHLSGYYDGILSAKIINDGFDVAYEIIDKIKPTA